MAALKPMADLDQGRGARIARVSLGQPDRNEDFRKDDLLTVKWLKTWPNSRNATRNRKQCHQLHAVELNAKGGAAHDGFRE
jgi:hypothetical protein